MYARKKMINNIHSGLPAKANNAIKVKKKNFTRTTQVLAISTAKCAFLEFPSTLTPLLG
jgi:hypothetical protein